ncbi:MAG: RnfABCDGE type electron transport complex subunit D [Chloroflexi bacterium]|nr:RnfABCDGE type electron transport complex subunit D [Chloroflexota bacterium]
MITMPSHQVQTLPATGARALQRFLRTPKGLMLLVLLLLAALATSHAGLALVLPGLIVAVAVACLLDTLLLRLHSGTWQAPTGALLTGLFLAFILDPHEPWIVAACASVVAINSKWLARTRLANVFNPAAVGLLAATLLFDSGQSWWGALPDLPWLLIGLLLMTTIYIADRVNKLPMIVAFLGVTFAIFAGVAFAGDPERVAEIFRVPTLNALLFFAGFMLTDPPTSPTRYRDQVIYAVIVAAACAAIFLTLGGVYFLPLGLLIGNAWEAGRRWMVGRRRAAVATAG